MLSTRFFAWVSLTRPHRGSYGHPRLAAAVLLMVVAGLARVALSAAAVAGPGNPAAGAATSAAGSAGSGASTSWFPSGTELVVRVRYRDLRSSALFKRLMTTRPMFESEMGRIEQFAAHAGLETARDLDAAT